MVHAYMALNAATVKMNYPMKANRTYPQSIKPAEIEGIPFKQMLPTATGRTEPDTDIGEMSRMSLKAAVSEATLEVDDSEQIFGNDSGRPILKRFSMIEKT